MKRKSWRSVSLSSSLFSSRHLSSFNIIKSIEHQYYVKWTNIFSGNICAI